MAEQVGQEYGRAMAAGSPVTRSTAGRRSLRSAMQAVADALTAHGFAAHAEHRNDQLRIINNHCPFGDVAIEHPVICAVDRGMVKGMLGALVTSTATTRRRHHRVELRPRRHVLRHRVVLRSDRATRLRRPVARSLTVSLAVLGVLDHPGDDVVARLGGRAAVERRLRVVLDHQLARLGGGAVDEHLDESQRHVDAARHAGGGDDPAVEVLDDPVARRRWRRVRASVPSTLQWVVAVRPSSSPAAPSTSEPVQTDVVNVVVSCAVRTQSSTRSSCINGRVPTPPGKTMMSGCG